MLRVGARERYQGHPFAAVTEHAASVYARRYYALSIPGHDGFCYQPASIRVVAAGYGWLAEDRTRAGSDCMAVVRDRPAA